MKLGGRSGLYKTGKYYEKDKIAPFFNQTLKRYDIF